MQKPDFEIVIEWNPNFPMSPLYQGATCAIAMQGAAYIRQHPGSGDDVHIQGWRERPEGWVKE